MSETHEDHVLSESWIEIVAAVGFDESHECWEDLHHAVERAARAATVAELERHASDLERRSDNVPMSFEGRGIERVGTLREIANRLRASAEKLED